MARAASRPVPSQITVTRMRTADGSVITVAHFAATERYVLHDGSWDPASPYSHLVNAGRAVGAAEHQQLVAAFNGGFLMSSHAGGYEQETHVFKKLLPGLASLVIDRSGQARICGVGVAARPPGARPSTASGRTCGRWWAEPPADRGGGTVVALGRHELGHVALDPRSALGQDAAGGLTYAERCPATPQDMADALARSGALIAMELDIKRESSA